MMVSLVACTGDNGENSETPVTSGNDVVEETETNHITLAESWGFENFYTIMTPDVSASNFGITYYLSNFYDVLVEYQDGEYVGGLAEDWTISEDGTVYTFNLRHDVKFSDGSDLTAEDVAKSLLAVPINLGQYNGTYGRLSTIIEDAVVVDDYTVEMHLTQPYYNALRELCLANPFGIVSSEQLNDDLTKKDTFETATYGTGPYMYAGDNDGQTWNFESNPYYWGERPDVESFSIKSIPDNDAKILALKNGEIDFVAGITNVSNESFVEMQNTEGFGAKVDDKSFRTGYIGYNLSSSMFGDEVVRQAITLALDKDAISESIYGGLYEKADTFFPKTLPYCDVEQTVYSYDIDRANQLLDEAGYIDTDGDGIREKDGEKLSSPFQYQAGSASDDNLVVQAEIFHLWVIEAPQEIAKEFPADKAGLNVLFVPSEAPYHERKVTLLNGPHTVLSPVAYLSGVNIVREACEHEVIGKYIHKVMFDELMETLNLPKDELEKFANDVLERFNNPFVDHAVTSIMLNSFPKYETRDLPGLKTYLERKGELPKGLVLGLAAIITYYKGGVRADGAEIVPNDAPEIMNLLKELWATGCTKKVAEGVLAADFIWGEDLNKIPGLAEAVKANLDSIQEKGMLETVKGIL